MQLRLSIVARRLRRRRQMLHECSRPCLGYLAPYRLSPSIDADKRPGRSDPRAQMRSMPTLLAALTLRGFCVQIVSSCPLKCLMNDVDKGPVGGRRRCAVSQDCVMKPSRAVSGRSPKPRERDSIIQVHRPEAMIAAAYHRGQAVGSGLVHDGEDDDQRWKSETFRDLERRGKEACMGRLRPADCRRR